jgi:uncharacterized alkaline shock family protein YloU
MKIIRAIVLLLVLVVLLATGILLMVATVIPPPESEPSMIGHILRPGVLSFCLGLALFSLGALLALTGLRRRQRERFLSFDTDSGRVSISTEAICNYIAKLSSEFPSIVRMTPRVIPRRGVIDVLVNVCIKAGPQIHEVCEVLQKRVRDSLASGLGISEVRRVEVSVKEISSEHKAE